MPTLRTELYLSIGEQDTSRPFVMVDINYSYSPARGGNLGQKGAPEPAQPAEALILGVKVVADRGDNYVLPPWAFAVLHDQMVAAVLAHEDDARASRRAYSSVAWGRLREPKVDMDSRTKGYIDFSKGGQS